jgi:hypothetical protein
MKKITLMLLVAMVPFLTMAQKRSKKESSKLQYEMMVIKGVEVPFGGGMNIADDLSPDQAQDYEAKIAMEKGKVMVTYDFGNVTNKENTALINLSGRITSMVAAVDALAAKGWQFVSANVVPGRSVTTHYYYMRRDK